MPVPNFVSSEELLEVIRILVNPPWGREVKGLTAAEIYDIYGGSMIEAINTRTPYEIVSQYKEWCEKHPNGLPLKED